MIIVRLKGGLGNQLFQYSFAKYVGHLTTRKVYLDTFWYGESRRKYHFPLSIENFNVRLNKLPVSVAKHYGQYAFAMKLLGGKIFNFVPVRVTDDNFSEDIIKANRNVVLDGYWEDHSFFDGLRDDLLREVTLKRNLSNSNEEYYREISHTDSVSVHFRGGQYLSDPDIRNLYADLSRSYYSTAMDIMNHTIGRPRFYVFTNDIPEARKTFVGIENVTIIESKSPDFEHLYLMSQCKHNIIGNSTFSWWGAWLNKNANKVVVAPKLWFAPDNHARPTSIPPDWIRVDN